MELKKIRKKIDKIDSKILKLVDARMKLMPHVAAYKRMHKLKISDPKREKELLKAKVEKGSQMGLNKDLVEKLYMMFIKEGKNIQRKEKK